MNEKPKGPRHPNTEGNGLRPAGVKTQPGTDVVVVDEQGNETSLQQFSADAEQQAKEQAAAHALVIS